MKSVIKAGVVAVALLTAIGSAVAQSGGSGSPGTQPGSSTATPGNDAAGTSTTTAPTKPMKKHKSAKKSMSPASGTGDISDSTGKK